MKFGLNLSIYAALIAVLNVACGPVTKEKASIVITDGLTDLIHAKVDTDKLDEIITCPASDHTPEKVFLTHELGTPYTDPNRDIKDLGTDFVVKEFFGTPDTLFNFIKLVYSRVGDAIKEYRSGHNLEDDAVVFIFKGGNVMRMLANQAFNMLPPDATKILKDRYAEFFKRSDADFSVLVDHQKLHNLNYESVMDDLVMLTYNVLNSIRDEITKNTDTYSNFFQLSHNVARKKLSKYFTELQNIPAAKDPENEKWFGARFLQLQLQEEQARPQLKCKYEGQYDFLYDFDKQDKSKIIGTPLNKRSKWIMNTINKALEWPSGRSPKDMVKFYLVRSKVQFEYSFLKDGIAQRLPIGGELIDISFPHKDDFRLAAFFKHLKRELANYTLTLDDTGESITMKAESLDGIATDLYSVLFDQFSRPWEASKYAKRVNRLFFFSIIEMLSQFGTGSDDLQYYVDDVEKYVLGPMEKVLPLGVDSRRMANRAERGVRELRYAYPELPIANHFFVGLARVVTKRFFKDPKDNDEQEFNEMVKLIRENLSIISELSKLPQAKINMDKLYHTTMKSLF